jgi:ArsR family transcriptional regulator, virulence genes transcriptional regulator
MLDITDEIDAIQATLLRALASPHRLRIVHRLGGGPLEVTELARTLGISQASMSQHLAALRAVGIVEAHRDGRSVRYGLADPAILAACGLMREVLVRRLSRLGGLAAAAADVAPSAGSSPTGDEPVRFAAASKVGPS